MEALQQQSIEISLKQIFEALGLTPDLPVGFNSDGELVNVSGVAIDGVTASAAEINKLDGATVSTAEINILDGVTASTAEINLLDGAGEIVASGTQQDNVADAEVAHSLNAVFSNTEVETALDALGTKVNTILASLEAFEINAAS